MKRSLPQLQLLVFVALTVWSGCTKKDAAPAAEENKSPAPGLLVKHGSAGEVIITLSAATQQILGLQTAPLVAKELSPEVKATASVVDPAQLSDLLMELARMELAYDTTHRELERMKVLRKDSNTSERAFEAIEAQYRLDVAAIYAVRLKIQRAYGNKMAELTGPVVVPVGTERKLDQLLSELADARDTLLVRVDLPAGEELKESPASARLVGFAAGAIPVDAAFFDYVPTIDLQTQTRGMFFVVRDRPARLAPGLALTAFLKTDQAPEHGVLVPRDAVVRFNGAAWVYLQTGAETFQRMPIIPDCPLADGWFIRAGLKSEDKIVTVGAQLILSAEMSAAGFSDGEHH